MLKYREQSKFKIGLIHLDREQDWLLDMRQANERI